VGGQRRLLARGVGTAAQDRRPRTEFVLT